MSNNCPLKYTGEIFPGSPINVKQISKSMDPSGIEVAAPNQRKFIYPLAVLLQLKRVLSILGESAEFVNVLGHSGTTKAAL